MPVLLQINTALNTSSHGKIAEQIGILAMKKGWDCYIIHGARYKNTSQLKAIQLDTPFQELIHGIKSIIFDKHGLGSTSATKKIIKKIKEINPDVIHLHNIHGYYLNYKILFKYLSEINIPIVWTLHDCWSMTGHCSHFDTVGCEKWKTECHNCPILNKEYPISLLFDRSRQNYLLKKQCFTSVKNMTIVPVSNWLADIVKQSYLAKYSTQRIYNGIDIQIFIPKNANELRKKLNIGDKFVILGVANPWTEFKGIKEFIKLSQNTDYKVIMVGVNPKLKCQLPDSIISVLKTEDQIELAEYYSLADVFVNPTYKDSFPTTNMEALACGTPVITYRTGGSPESVNTDTGFVVERGDFQGLIKAVEEIHSKGKSCYSDNCRNLTISLFNKDDRFNEYIQLYENLNNHSNI